MAVSAPRKIASDKVERIHKAPRPVEQKPDIGTMHERVSKRFPKVLAELAK